MPRTVESPYDESKPWLDQARADEVARQIAVLSLTKVYTNAQIIAWPTTPLTVLAAQGANKLILPMSCVLSVDSSAGAYGNIGLNIGTGITAVFPQIGIPVFGVVPSTIMANLLGGNSGNLYWLAPSNNSLFVPADLDVINEVVVAGAAKSNFPLASAINQPFVLALDNYSADYETNRGNFTGGHVNNSMTVTFIYTVVDL